MVIYIWRILEKQVPDLTSGKIYSINVGGRLGRKCSFPSIKNNAPTEIKNIRYACLSVKGPRLFNALPAELRNLTNISVKAFKRQLDRYLARVPDEPLIPGYTAMRRADSNSLRYDTYIINFP